MIKVMLSSGTSGCASALVDLQQQLRNRIEWIFELITSSIIDKALKKVPRDHPDLYYIVKAQVSVL